MNAKNQNPKIAKSAKNAKSEIAKNEIKSLNLSEFKNQLDAKEFKEKKEKDPQLKEKYEKERQEYKPP